MESQLETQEGTAARQEELADLQEVLAVLQGYIANPEEGVAQY